MGSEVELAAALRTSAAARAKEALKLETARRASDARVRAAHRGDPGGGAGGDRAGSAGRSGRVGAGGGQGSVPPSQPGAYGWFAVMGSGLDLRAAVTDGANVWRVEAGDRLPGGVRVVAVEARPPGVRVTGWTTDRLPYRSRGGQ